MNTWLVIPVKSLRDGKSRLASVLDLEQRHVLVDRLLVHTLKQASSFPGLDRTLVVSACAETLKRATVLGASTLAESGQGLNPAVAQALTEVRRLQADQVLIIPCDLPLLCAEDIRSLAHTGRSGTVAIAPDRNQSGTNGMCLDAGLNFTFEFGPQSYARHIEAIKREHLEPLVILRPGLAFDVDTPDDLDELGARGGFVAVSERTK